MTRRVVGLLVFCLTLSGCGYSLRGSLPSHLKTLAIPVFVNKTQEPAVENLVTQGVIEAFVNNGLLKIAESSKADAILEGEVVGYQVLLLSFNSAQNVTEYRVQVTVNLQFREVKADRVAWRREGFTEKSDFKVAGQVQNITQQSTALRQAVVDIGRAIVAITVDRF